MATRGGGFRAARAWPEATARSQKSIEVSFFISKSDVSYDFCRQSIKVSFFISKNDTFYDFLFAGVQRRSKFNYFQIGDAICEKRRKLAEAVTKMVTERASQ